MHTILAIIKLLRTFVAVVHKLFKKPEKIQPRFNAKFRRSYRKRVYSSVVVNIVDTLLSNVPDSH